MPFIILSQIEAQIQENKKNRKQFCKSRRFLFRTQLHGGNRMVHQGMVGITELMMDESFLCWMEIQDDNFLEDLSTFEIYCMYQKAD
jgi:hypothetical protein